MHRQQLYTFLAATFLLGTFHFSQAQNCYFVDLKVGGKEEMESRYDVWGAKEKVRYFITTKKDKKGWTYGMVTCLDKKRLIKPGRFYNWKRMVKGKKYQRTGFMATDAEDVKHHIRYDPEKNDVVITPLPELQSLHMQQDNGLHVAIMKDNETGRNYGLVVNQNWKVLQMIPNIIPFEKSELGDQKVERRFNYQEVFSEFSYRIGHSLVFKTANQGGSVYFVCGQNGRQQSPPVPEISVFKYKFGPEFYGNWMAIPIDKERGLYLPFKKYGGPRANFEEGLLGYQPLFVKGDFWDYEEIIHPSLASFRSGDNYFSKDTQELLIGWVKVYERDGTRQFGFASHDRELETGPIWAGSDLRREFSNGTFLENNWKQNTVSSYGHAFDYYTVESFGKKIVRGTTYYVLYAQLLDGGWQAYQTKWRVDDKLKNDKPMMAPILDQTYPTKTAMFAALKQHFDGLKQEAKAAKVRSQEYNKALEEKWEAERIAAKEAKIAKWKKLVQSSMTELEQYNFLRFSYELDGDYLAQACVKFREIAQVWDCYEALHRISYSHRLHKQLLDMAREKSAAIEAERARYKAEMQATEGQANYYYIPIWQAPQQQSYSARQQSHYNKQFTQFWSDFNNYGSVRHIEVYRGN